MGDQDNDFVCLQHIERFGKAVASLIVEPSGGFVEDKYRGIRDKCTRECQTLPLSHAQLRTSVKQAAKHSPRALRQAVDNLVRPRQLKSLADVCLVINVAKTDILLHCAIIAHKVLKKDANMPAKLVRRVLPNIGTIEEYRSLLGIIEP